VYINEQLFDIRLINSKIHNMFLEAYEGRLMTCKLELKDIEKLKKVSK